MNRKRNLLIMTMFAVIVGFMPGYVGAQSEGLDQDVDTALYTFYQEGRYFPNGSIVKSNRSAKVYFIDNNTKRPIESPAMLESRFDWKSLIVTSQEAIDEIPMGEVMKFRDGSLISYGGSVYIVSDGTRRPISSPQVFLGLGFKWSSVKAVSQTELNVHPLGTVVDTKNYFLNGMLLQAPSGSVYYLEGGVKRYIASPNIFTSMFKWDSLVKTTDTVINGYKSGTDMYYPNGTLISGNGTVYLMQSGKKRPIQDPATFESHGLSWAMVKPATDFELNVIPTGTPFNTLRYYPNGTLVKSQSSNRVYVFENDVLRAIPSPTVFFARGYNFNHVLTFSDRVINAYPKGTDLQ